MKRKQQNLENGLEKENNYISTHLTQRAVDLRDSARFISIFLASGFSTSQAFSPPAHQRLTQTVERTYVL
jgi:hypothetical protein